jgi:hypothetical protein
MNIEKVKVETPIKYWNDEYTRVLKDFASALDRNPFRVQEDNEEEKVKHTLQEIEIERQETRRDERQRQAQEDQAKRQGEIEMRRKRQPQPVKQTELSPEVLLQQQHILNLLNEKKRLEDKLKHYGMNISLLTAYYRDY